MSQDEDQLAILARDSLATDHLRASAASSSATPAPTKATTRTSKHRRSSNINNTAKTTTQRESIYGTESMEVEHHRNNNNNGKTDDDDDGDGGGGVSSNSSITSSEELRRRSVVGWLLMLFLSFASDTSGPAGVEDAIGSAGPGPTLLLLILTPVIVSVPTLLLMWECMELMPSNHGVVRWVAVGLGPFWGFINAMFQALVNTVDVAVYPVLTQRYLFQLFFPDYTDAPFGVKYAVRVAVILICGVQNYFSIREQAWYAVVMTVLIMTPFLVGLFMGSWWENPGLWVESVPHVQPGTFLPIGLWLYAGTLVSASVTEDAESVPELMKSWFWSVPLEVVCYVFPLIVALPYDTEWTNWEAGYLVTMYKKINKPLGYAVGIGQVLSNMSLYATNIVFSVRFLWSMADIRWLPSVLSKQNRWHVPYHCVTVNIVCSLILNLLDFDFIVENEIVLTTVNQIMFIFAFVKIRALYPDMPRPYRVPLEIMGVFCISVPKIFLYCASAGASLAKGWECFVFFLVCSAIVVGLYYLAKWQGAMDGEELEQFCTLREHHHFHHHRIRHHHHDSEGRKSSSVPSASSSSSSSSSSGSDDDGAHRMRDDLHYHHHYHHDHHHHHQSLAATAAASTTGRVDDKNNNKKEEKQQGSSSSEVCLLTDHARASSSSSVRTSAEAISHF